MRKIIQILSWSLGVIALIVAMSFTSSLRKDTIASGPVIEIKQIDNQRFLKNEDIEMAVRLQYPDLDSMLLREINIHLLEESIDNHPSIRKAEVYSGLDGTLRIEVFPKKPVARIYNSGRAYYLDEIGDSMALSENFSAEVPLITGKASPKIRHQIFEFIKLCEGDDLYDGFFGGININEEDEWTLYPKPGRHSVLMGRFSDVEAKLDKLKVFYEQTVDKDNIDSLKSINLKFEGQVICRKY